MSEAAEPAQDLVGHGRQCQAPPNSHAVRAGPDKSLTQDGNWVWSA